MLEIALGIVTSVGGYLEAGSLATALQAGAAFRFDLLWAILLGTVCIAFLVEMGGRLAAVSRHTIADAVRERFGFRFHSVGLAGQVTLDLLVLTSEIGGVAYALQLATGVACAWWAVPVALGVWLLLWFGRFKALENGMAVLGLVTLAFVVAAVRMRPPLDALARGAIPTVPASHTSRYLYLAVSTLGATISPYLVSFYSSGAVEEQWDESHLRSNRIVAGVGMGFGAIVWIGAMVMAALVLHPQGVEVSKYDDAAWVLSPVFRAWGFWLFVASLGIGCLGAALETGLDVAYIVAQGLGWNWGEDQRPQDDSRFAGVYTLSLLVATVPIALGADPLRVTMLAMALTVVVLPLVVLPLLVIMNDERYMKAHVNGPIANAAVVIITALGAVLALLAIPLQFTG